MAPYTTSLTLLIALLASCVLSALASPFLPAPTQLTRVTRPTPRQDDAQPTFPDEPPSCPICEQNFASIDSCAQAAPVLANFSMVSVFANDWSGRGMRGECERRGRTFWKLA